MPDLRFRTLSPEPSTPTGTPSPVPVLLAPSPHLPTAMSHHTDDGGPAPATKSRTSISLDPETMRLARERAETLGYETVSAYFSFLIQHDAQQSAAHQVFRDESGPRYLMEPKSPVTYLPPKKKGAGRK